MPNLTDKEIDRLSREAAEFYEPDDSALSWSKLEQKLNDRIPDKPPGSWSAGRLRPYAWGSVILALTGLTYFLIKTEKHTPNSTNSSLTKTTTGKSKEGMEPADASRNPSNHSTVPPTLLPSSAEGSTGRDVAKRDQPALDSRQYFSGHDLNDGAETGKTTNHVHSKKYREKKSVLFNEGLFDQPRESVLADHTDPANPDLPLTDQVSDGSKKYSSNAVTNNGGGIGNEMSFANLPDLYRSNRGRPLVSFNDSLLNRFPAPANVADNHPKHSGLNINRSLTIGIGMGPDYTDGGGITDDQLSNNIGLSLGYYLTRRLSVNTGFYYTKKYYWSDGKSFRIPTIWPMAFPVQYVNGSCDMLEIPLTLKYDFPVSLKTNFFVNGGLSSYLMRRQTYTFYYHNAATFYGKTFENDAHANYLFSVINLSAGFERQLGNGFSFQAEPFVKLPTKGVGFGNIKMNSYGMLFSLRYSPVLKRSRK